MIQQLNTSLPDKWVICAEVQISTYRSFAEISFHIEILSPDKPYIITNMISLPLFCTTRNNPHPAEYRMMICIELLAGVKL